MPYSELIKNFSRIRDYMREFYVYGFKRREQFDQKSGRSYDNERRRAESWLGDHMRFRQTPQGKTVFLSIDSRVTRRNPLYAAWKAKSFTDGDITLHFLLFDILYSPDTALSVSQIAAQIDARLADAPEPPSFDESTLRKKLKEYASLGLILPEKRGRAALYRREPSLPLPDPDALDFFSETAPCGVVGSFLLDKLPPRAGSFVFKHHYFSATLDSEILCALFDAMHASAEVTLTVTARNGGEARAVTVLPLRVFISVQTGRQHLLAFRNEPQPQIAAFRLDHILSVAPGRERKDLAQRRAALEAARAHMWGVSTAGLNEQTLQRVEFTVTFGPDETFIPQRLEREKRCGTVERIDETSCRFTAEVYDAVELFPWIRTFIGRIVSLRFSSPALQQRFWNDIEEMRRMYAEGGDQA